MGVGEVRCPFEACYVTYEQGRLLLPVSKIHFQYSVCKFVLGNEALLCHSRVPWSILGTGSNVGPFVHRRCRSARLRSSKDPKLSLSTFVATTLSERSDMSPSTVGI